MREDAGGDAGIVVGGLAGFGADGAEFHFEGVAEFETARDAHGRRFEEVAARAGDLPALQIVRFGAAGERGWGEPSTVPGTGNFSPVPGLLVPKLAAGRMRDLADVDEIREASGTTGPQEAP